MGGKRRGKKMVAGSQERLLFQRSLGAIHRTVKGIRADTEKLGVKKEQS